MRIGPKRGRAIFRQIAKARADVSRLESTKMPAGCFFFAETKRNIFTKFKSLYGGAGFDEVKAGVQQLTAAFGWYLTLKTIAESGIFNRPDMTPLQSAESADLYEAFTYLSACKAESEYQKRLQNVKK